MKTAFLAAGAVLLLAASCGKVADPLPPVLRVPQRIGDLTGSQNAYNLMLTWTNPARYVDGNPANDPATIQVFQNGMPITALPLASTGPGKSQSYGVDVTRAVGRDLTFSIEVTPSRGKPSGSNTFSIQPVAVPGPVTITAAADQRRIRLEWQAPAQNPSLAEAFVVQRTDKPGAIAIVKENSWEDEDVEQGKTYRYTVTPARGDDARVPGIPSAVEIIAIDKTPPQAPSGLKIELLPGGGGLLTWDENSEKDLAGYRLYRNNGIDAAFTELTGPMPLVTNAFQDPTYQPGYSYALLAEDIYGNQSPRSSTQAVN